MARNAYSKGQLVRVTGTFKQGGANADPDTVVFKMLAPDGTLTTYTYPTDAQLKKSAVGIYYVDVDAALEGAYRYRWAATGTGQAATEGEFFVEDSRF